MQPMPDTAPRLYLRDLVVTTKSGRSLLDLPALDIPAGQCVGITGPSGAGKSTLLYALSGLLQVAGGQIRWGETELLSLSDGARAAFRADTIGMIFQDFLLFDEMGAKANAALAALFLPRSRRRALVGRAQAALDRLGIDQGARSVASFSGGERQRVAVARALANDPGILLADEPTASLHRIAADQLIDDLIGLARNRNKTLIAVSHDMALVERMDRVLTITDGRITEDRML